MNSLSIYMQQPLALATSQIHRSRSLADLQKVFLAVTPQFVDADVYGLYLFDEKLEPMSVISHHAKHKFLSEYEKIRIEDPLFNYLKQEKKFTHSLDIFNQQDWLRQPLHNFLSRWGLDYSIEAPLVHDGHISGTLNFAIGGKKYFGKESLFAARFLCNEFNLTYKRILEYEKLKHELNDSVLTGDSSQQVPKRAQQVLNLLVTGLNNQAISEHLNISENTVRYHVKHIYKTIGVHNRAQLVRHMLTANSRIGSKVQ